MADRRIRIVPPTHREEPAPERIGVYRIERRIGKGGMGEVFLAWDERLERRVAIKRIRQEAGLSTEHRERFRREARLAARLSHPAIVQIHDLVTEGASDAIVMEYAEGETLAQRMAAGRLDTVEALRLALEVAEGMAAAHEAGLIHRDLKADNVIVTPAGHAKILDFGLSRPIDPQERDAALTSTGVVMGTCHAMSPEQARGEEVDERSDLFSFGSLLYEMLTGRSPFRGTSQIDSLTRVLHDQPPPLRTVLPDLPEDLSLLVESLLAKAPEERPRGARAAARRLARAAADLSAAVSATSDLPTAVSPLPRPERLRGERSLSWVSTARNRRIAAGAVAFLILLATVLVLLQKTRPPEAAALRVFVPEPVLAQPGDPRLQGAAPSLQIAVWSRLASLQGVTVIDAAVARRGGSSLSDMARAAAAQEILIIRLGREGEMGRVLLRRVRVSDQAVLRWHELRVPLETEQPTLLAKAVALQLAKIYPEHPERPGTPPLEVREEDFAAFLSLRRDLDAGQLQLAPALSRLEEITRSSPRFLEARLLTTQVSLALFSSTREGRLLELARRQVRVAHRLAPNDPRPVALELGLALTENREDVAEAALARLEELLPGDPELLVRRSRLQEHRGELAQAAASLRLAVEQAPAWNHRLQLAQLEGRLNRIGEARRQIREILRESPNNPWATESLGFLELLYGDLEKAERIYSQLARTTPRFSHFANLGLIRSLSGEYESAADAYRKALEIAPENLNALVGLADAEIELGRRGEAEALYRRTLERIEEAPTADLSPYEALLEAQCLARLGRVPEAVAKARQAVRRSPDDPEVHQQAALVFALAGDHRSAAESAGQALDRGLSPRWFASPVFNRLRDEPELRARLAAP